MLFISCINDITAVLILINIPNAHIFIIFNIILLADDTKILSQSNNDLQMSLDIMYSWLKSIKLKLAPSKFYDLNIHNHKTKPSDFNINDIKLPPTKVF